MSAAKVDVNHSEFTRLPNIWRILMITDGSMVVDHEGHHRVALQPFEQDEFSGAWMTRSEGRASDYNLMLSEDFRGALKAIKFNLSNHKHREIISPTDNIHSEAWETLYCVDGTITVAHDSVQDRLHAGDFMLIHRHRLQSDVTLKVELENPKSRDVSHIIRGTLTRRAISS
jgi:uncharacterized protein